jgi:hypothetical protein
MEKFYLKKLNDVDVNEECQVKISNRFAGLENLDDNDVDVNRAWEVIEYESFSYSLGYYEFKHCKP